MTRRATFTEAELKRAIRAAAAAGKVALQTPAGIAFVDPAFIPHTPPEESKVDAWFRQHDND
jgi:hypothetical protein